MAAKVRKDRSQTHSSAAKAKRDVRVGVRLSKFARALVREWKRLELPQANAQVIVAVSGGADSTALLLLLDESIKANKLNVELCLAHLDHGLRKDEGPQDARWVKALARQLGYEIAVKSVNVRRLAAKTGDNLEQAARRARYEFLANVADKKQAQILLTGHTLDDQAETVLLNLLRGSGSGGLGGIEPVRPLSKGNETLLARPLLSWARRRDTESYCRSRGVDIRVDEMNADERFARVRVRRRLLPLMESFNPKIVESLARAAELIREDSVILEHAAKRLLELSSEYDGVPKAKDRGRPRLRLELFATAQPALRRRALRQWINECRGDLRRVERVHIAAVESLLLGERGGRVVELPGGAKISRTRGWLEYMG